MDHKELVKELLKIGFDKDRTSILIYNMSHKEYDIRYHSNLVNDILYDSGVEILNISTVGEGNRIKLLNTIRKLIRSKKIKNILDNSK